MSKIDVTTAPEVTDRASAEAFTVWCVRTIGPGWHPDDRLKDYIDGDTREPSFTPAQVDVLEPRIDAAHRFLGDEIYTVGLMELAEQRGDPLPRRVEDLAGYFGRHPMIDVVHPVAGESGRRKFDRATDRGIYFNRLDDGRPAFLPYPGMCAVEMQFRFDGVGFYVTMPGGNVIEYLYV